MILSRRCLLTLMLGGAAVTIAACGGRPATTTPTQAAQPTTTTAAGRSPGTPGVAPALNLFSGRNKLLIDDVVKEFSRATDTRVEVRYAKDPELVAAMIKGGPDGTADAFFSHDAGPLAALTNRGLLTKLPTATQRQVDERFRAPTGEWVGVSGRARSVIYNSKKLTERELPDTINGFTESRWSGKIGWIPSDSSFIDFLTAMRVVDGEAATRQWLTSIKANNPTVFKGSNEAIAAVGDGQLDATFVNHYYLTSVLNEKGQDYPIRIYYPRNGGVGALVNISGVAIPKATTQPETAQKFVDYLLSAKTQFFFASRTSEYAMFPGVKVSDLVASLDAIKMPKLDLNQLADIEGTQALMRELGVV